MKLILQLSFWGGQPIDMQSIRPIPHLAVHLEVEKSEYAVTPFKLNEMPKINEISHFAHIDYQAFAINDCTACF